jgi:phosphoserine phosphatase RsbU/P
VLVPRCLTDDCSFLVEMSEEYVERLGGERERLLQELRIMPVGQEGTFLGRALRLEVPVHMSSLAEEPMMQRTALLETGGTSMVVAPLMAGGKRLGVLVLTLAAQERPGDHDWEVFTTLAEQSGSAVLNGQLHEDARKGRMAEMDLRDAQEVQRVLQPDGDPEVEGYVVCGKNRAARHLSGDFYDYVWPDGDHFGGVIADVSGKGLPAALVAASARSAVEAHALNRLQPKDTLVAVNSQIYDDIREDIFVTMSYFIVKLGEPRVKLCRAGHTPALLWVAATGEIRPIDCKGISIGIDRGPVFAKRTCEVEFEMAAGDCLVLYTDGVNEAMKEDEVEFGDDRLWEVIQASAVDGAAAVVVALLGAVDEFMGGKDRSDDITVMVLQKT